jgi:hypothetical protein
VHVLHQGREGHPLRPRHRHRDPPARSAAPSISPARRDHAHRPGPEGPRSPAWEACAHPARKSTFMKPGLRPVLRLTPLRPALSLRLTRLRPALAGSPASGLLSPA